MDSVLIRRERRSDFEAIREVTLLAFAGMPFADGDEHQLTDALRSAGALAVSLVAEKDGRVVGHVAISNAYSGDGSPGWYALGPVSVLPAFQRSGIGSALISKGIEALEELGASGCILTGDPDFYARFGFRLDPSLAPPEEPPEYFMVRLMGGEKATQPISFHRAFHENG